MISGSYTEGIVWFKGKGKGVFAEKAAIKRENGQPLQDESAAAPALGDWNGDGKLDMVVGYITGPVRLYLGKGMVNGSPTFTMGEDLTGGGKKITASDGGPCLVDWNGDKVLDLVLGDGDGSVRFYPGKKVNGKLELQAAQPLIGARKDIFEGVKMGKSGLTPAEPGTGARTKPFPMDWNGDGKLDLLAGDFLNLAQPPKKLTAAEAKRLKEIDAEMEQAGKEQEKAFNNLYDKATKELGFDPRKSSMTQEQQKQFSDWFMKQMESDADYRAVQEKFMKLNQERSKYVNEPTTHGFVWVYLRK